MNRNPYPDLRTAGRALAERLSEYSGREDTIVLAIALGGVPVADEVARHLNLPLDFILIRRLLHGGAAGAHLCAVNVAGQMILDEGLNWPQSPVTPQDIFLAEALGKFEARGQLCRRGKELPSLKERTVLLVDCGIRTGSTMNAAARALHKTDARAIIGAVPVTSREGYVAVSPSVDELIYLQQPEQFVNAGFWYADFRRPGDDQVGELLGPTQE